MIDDLLSDIKNNTEPLLEFIREGEIDKKYLPKLYNLFADKKYLLENSRKLKYELLLSIRKHHNMQDIKLLSDTLKISEVSASSLISNEAVIFPIVVVDNNANTEKIIHGVFIDCDIGLFTFPNEKESLIKSLSNLSKALNKKFFVVFEDYFTGNSFMLALSACIVAGKKVFDRYFFTGEIKADGSILLVNHLEEKKLFAQKHNKILCSHEHFSHIKELDFFNEKEIHLPFIQLFGKDEFALEANFSFMKSVMPYFENFKKINNLKNSDFCVYDSSMLPLENLSIQNRWIDCLIEAKSKIKRLYTLDSRVRVHLLGSLSTYMFALGVILGIKNGVDIYHYQDNKYFHVINASIMPPRALKEKKDAIKYLKYTIKRSNNTELSIIIYLASHNPKIDANDFIEQHLKTSVLEISINTPGNIPVNKSEMWVDIISEIYTLINDIGICLKSKITKYHFFISTPVPIATGLGMALGNYVPFVLYQFDIKRNTYVPVIDSTKTDIFDNTL